MAAERGSECAERGEHYCDLSRNVKPRFNRNRVMRPREEPNERKYAGDYGDDFHWEIKPSFGQLTRSQRTERGSFASRFRRRARS
jgi:hypothetical protein